MVSSSSAIADLSSSAANADPDWLASVAYDNTFGDVVVRVFRACLSKEWFCWVSRGIVQMQSLLRPRVWSYWTEIPNQNIYVGAMPLKNWDHVNEINKLGVGAVLSITEVHERETQWGADPVQKGDWQGRSIEHLELVSPDLEPVETAIFIEAVDYLDRLVSAGKRVFVHCNGGRGRSASIVIAYLVKHQHFSAREAIGFVQAHRPQCMLSQRQIRSILAYATQTPTNAAG
jgi:atypical dual specificity phosphatase